MQPNLNLGLVQRLSVPLPPALEQIEIIAEVESTLSSISHAETEITSSLARAGRLRQSILKRAFEGKLC